MLLPFSSPFRLSRCTLSTHTCIAVSSSWSRTSLRMKIGAKVSLAFPLSAWLHVSYYQISLSAHGTGCSDQGYYFLTSLRNSEFVVFFIGIRRRHFFFGRLFSCVLATTICLRTVRLCGKYLHFSSGSQVSRLEDIFDLIILFSFNIALWTIRNSSS